MVGNVFGDDAARANDGIFTDGDAGQDADSGADPGVFLNMDFLGSQDADILRLIIDRKQADFRPQHDPVFDGHRPQGHDRKVVIGKDILA